MSKGSSLRGFISERLSAASLEILAAVDRIVSEYEEEASGFRLQIDRQKKQLEVLLQPEVTADRAGVKRCRRVRTSEEEEREDEEEESTRPAPSGSRFKKRKPCRPQIGVTQTHVDLRIRILEDPGISVLSNSVLETCPLLKLKCPRGLQEGDFLDLLRSSFPQLTGDDTLFDILTSDKRRRLRRLQLKAVTPEEIHRNISCTDWKKSPIYIRLKRLKETQKNEEDSDPLRTRENDSEVLMCDKNKLHSSSPLQEPPHASTSNQQDKEAEDADDGGLSGPREDFEACCAAKSKVGDRARIGKVEEGEEEVEESDDDWKPDKSDDEFKDSDSELQAKTTKKPKSRRCGVKVTESGDALACRVCGALQESEVTLVKHAWSHVEDPESLCGVCGDPSESAEALKEHHLRDHRPEDCHVCGESLCGRLSFNEHVAAHSGEKPYECEVCPDRFALKASLENHQRLHEDAQLHKCHTCSKIFELKSQLKAHRVTHTHLCGVCGKSLSDYRSLSRHKMTHIEERPHSCQVCGRSFKLLGTLRQHEKIHTDRERSYLCDVCCKMFLTSKQLQIHMRTHTNEKPYHCGECGKGFTTKGPLTVHMRVHTGETPYRCPDCGWSFKRKVHLDNHMTVHSGLKPFVCGICGKACARKKYLKVHMRTHNGERPYKCVLCDKAFTQGHCLKTHMKSHQGGDPVT